MKKTPVKAKEQKGSKEKKEKKSEKPKTKPQQSGKGKSAAGSKKSQRPTPELETGDRVLYGKVVETWFDPRRRFDQWVLIKNDDNRAPPESFSLYKYRRNVNKGEFFAPHFIPKIVIEGLLSLDSELLAFGEQLEIAPDDVKVVDYGSRGRQGPYQTKQPDIVTEDDFVLEG